MAVATFDTLKFANTLKSAGVPPQQAEAQAQAFAEVIQLNLKDLVTKDDLAQAVKDLQHEMREVEQRMIAKIDNSASASAVQIERVRGELSHVRWMLGALVGGVITILIRLFLFRGPL